MMNKYLFKLPDDIDDINELKRRIKEALEIIYQKSFDETRSYVIDDLNSIDIDRVVYMLERGKD